jgi:hypothetical protein
MAFSTRKGKKTYSGVTRTPTMLKMQMIDVLLVDICSSWAKHPSHGAVKKSRQPAGQAANYNTAPCATVPARQSGFDYFYKSLELIHLSQPSLAWIIRVPSNSQKIMYSTTLPNIWKWIGISLVRMLKVEKFWSNMFLQTNNPLICLPRP